MVEGDRGAEAPEASEPGPGGLACYRQLGKVDEPVDNVEHRGNDLRRLPVFGATQVEVAPVAYGHELGLPEQLGVNSRTGGSTDDVDSVVLGPCSRPVPAKQMMRVQPRLVVGNTAATLRPHRTRTAAR